MNRLFLQYPKCTTCKRAKKYLEDNPQYKFQKEIKPQSYEGESNMQNNEKLRWKRAKADFPATFWRVGPKIHLLHFFPILGSFPKPDSLSDKIKAG